MHSAGQGGLKRTCTWLFNTRGGVEDTRLEAKAKDTKKPKAKDTKNPRPRTAFPRTDTLEAKDRNARGQGQGPRTQTQAFSKKRSSKFFFRRSQKKSLQKFFSGDLHKKRSRKKLFQSIYKILTIQKIVLSPSRGQGNFRGLETSRPRPRTSKCVLEEDDLEDSTSV